MSSPDNEPRKDPASAASDAGMTSEAGTEANTATAPPSSESPEKLPAAAEAAIALVQRSSQQGDVLRPARRLRVLALVAITLAVFAFAACIFTGAMLSMWASEELVVRHDSPPMIVFVEEHHGGVVLGHVVAGLLTLLALLGYAGMHVRYKRLLNELDIAEKARKRVFSGWTVVPITVIVAAGLGTTAVIGYALPEKPQTTEVLEEQLEGKEGDTRVVVLEGGERLPRDPLELDHVQRHASPIPDYVQDPQEEEAWMLHTFWLPLFLGLLLLVLLPAVYTLQRSREVLKQADKKT